VRRIANGTLRGNTSDIRAAVGAVKMIEAQPDLMTMAPAPKAADREALSRLERRVDQVVAMIAAGFQDGECVAAKRVDPSRMATLADKLVLARQTMAKMERQIRDAMAQAEILMARYLPTLSTSSATVGRL
jgi:ParB family chromosome partitioning protein